MLRSEGEGDRISLIPSEVSLVDLLKSPGYGSPWLDISQGGDEEAEKEEQKEEKKEDSFFGRVRGLFKRSFQ